MDIELIKDLVLDPEDLKNLRRVRFRPTIFYKEETPVSNINISECIINETKCVSGTTEVPKRMPLTLGFSEVMEKEFYYDVTGKRPVLSMVKRVFPKKESETRYTQYYSNSSGDFYFWFKSDGSIYLAHYEERKVYTPKQYYKYTSTSVEQDDPEIIKQDYSNGQGKFIVSLLHGDIVGVKFTPKRG